MSGKVKFTHRARVRFASTLVANVIRLGLNFLTGIFIARGLGPADYGNFNFLLTSFVALSQFIDMGTSTAFYTFVSRKKRGRRFYGYYAAWLAAQFILSLLLIGLLMPKGLRDFVWLGHGRGIILIAFIASFTMNQLWQAVSHAGESVRETITVQVYNIVVAFFYLSFVLILISADFLTGLNIFMFVAVQYLVFAGLLGRRLKEKLFSDAGEEPDFKEVFSEYRTFCSPLIVFTFVSFIGAFLRNWLLQKYGGPVQQGYFSVGFRFNQISMLVAASATAIIWKEVAEAQKKGDDVRAREIYFKASGVLYFAAAFLSCFLMTHSKGLMVWLFGPEYEPAWFCFSVMLLYPLHQSLGQVVGIMFYSTGKTVVIRNIALVFAPFGLLATYFILATPDATVAGLGMGANGLAVVLVGFTVISINVQRYIISRMLKWDFAFLFQATGVAVLLGFALASKHLAAWLLGVVVTTVSMPTLLVFSFVLYATAAAVALYRFPSLAGMERQELNSMVSKAIDFLNAGFGKM